MRYSVSDTPLKLREYGRNVQSLIEFAKTVKNRKVRSMLSKEIVKIMGSVNANVKENPEYEQILWEHFYALTDYDIDIDAPYPMPVEERRGRPVPAQMPYNKGMPMFRQYGRNVELMIRKAVEAESKPERDKFLHTAAAIMWQILKSMNRDNNIEATIANHIRALSYDKLRVIPRDFVYLQEKMSKITIAPQPQQKNNQSNNKNQGKKNNRNNKKYNKRKKRK